MDFGLSSRGWIFGVVLEREAIFVQNQVELGLQLLVFSIKFSLLCGLAAELHLRRFQQFYCIKLNKSNSHKHSSAHLTHIHIYHPSKMLHFFPSFPSLLPLPPRHLCFPSQISPSYNSIQIQTARMNLDIPTINSRLVSSVQKREVMWNIIEPGDPYDIRKSMIAKLPGQKNFMGDHLEMVCLLQAAEIERLCQYLDEYKLKFREVERRELDRHSYEVQIKELTMRISDEGNFKAENLKLREFLRKQSAEFQEMKKKLATGGYEAELVRKYEESLRQVESYIRENEGLKDSLMKFRQEYQQVVNSKNLEIDDLQRRLREASAAQSGRGDAYYKLEIEYKKLEFENKRIKEITETKNREIEELQLKSKQLVYQLEEQSTQITQYSNVSVTIKEYENRFTLLGKEIERLNNVLRDKSSQLNELTGKYRLAEEEKRRFNEYILDLENRKGQLGETNRQLEYRVMEISNGQSVLEESRTVMKTYEGNIEKLSMEIERLNTVLRKKIAELEEANRRLNEYEFQLRKNEGVRKEVDDFRLKFSDYNRKMAEYQSKIALTSQEIERLNQALKRKNDELSLIEQQLKQRTYDLQSAQKQYYNLEIQYKSQITYITTNYQSRISQLDRENQTTRSKLQDQSISQSRNLQGELERLNLLMTNKNAEIERLQNDLLASRQRENSGDKQRLIQWQSQLNYSKQENEQLRNSLDQYQRRIIMLSQEIERLNVVLKKGNSPSPSRITEEQLENKRIVTQYENKLAIITQEIDRLNDNLRAKDIKLRSNQQQLDLFRRRQEDQLESTVSELKRRENQAYAEIERLTEELRIAQQNLNRKNSDHQMTTTMYKENESKMRQLYEENHQLSRRTAETEHQVVALSNEIQRLNGVLKLKVDALDSIELKLRNGAKESDELRRKLSEYENKIALLAQENERIKSNYQLNSQYEIDNYKRKIAEQEKRLIELQGYTRETDTKYRTTEQQIRTYEQQIRSSYQQVETLRVSLNETNRKYSDYQGKIVILSREIERLNDLLEKFNAENQETKRKLLDADQLRSGFAALEERLARSAQENEDLRKKLNEGHQSKTKLNQDYQGRIRQLNTEKEQQFRRIQEQETKLSYLVQEVEHANSVAKDRTDQVNSLQMKIRSLVQENEGLGRRLQEITSMNRKIGEYDNKIALLSQEIERLNGLLRAKVEDISNLEKKCLAYELELNGYQRKVADYESNFTKEVQFKNNLAKENQELKVKLRQLSQEAGRVPDIENRFALTLGEVERLNSTLRAKVEEINSLGGKIRALEQELDRSKRKGEELEATMHRQLKNQSSVFEQRVGQLSQENEGFRRNLRELSDHNRRIPELQNKIVILSTEIERLNGLLAKYSKEVIPSLQERNRGLSLECDEFRKKCSELMEINKQGQEINSRFRIVSQENEQNVRRVQEYETRMSQISGEIERLNGVLRGKIQDLANTEAKLKQVMNENEQLNKRLRETTDTARRVPEYESKLAILGQEIERLNGLLRARGDELTSTEGKLRMLEHEYESLQRKLGDQESSLVEQKKYRSVLQQKLNNLNAENEELRKTLRELSDSNRRLAQYESRMALLSQQVERLNGNLRMKTEQLNASQNTLRNVRKEADSKLQNISIELEEYRRKASETMSSQASRLAEYEGKMVILSKEIERLNLVLKETTYEFESIQIREKQYLQEIERLNNILRLKVQEVTRLEQINGQLKLKLRSFEENFNNCNAEYEKLKQQHNILAEEYKKSNQHLVEYEQSINKLYQEFQRLQSIIQSLKKENYELKVKLQEAGNLVEKNRVLSAEIDRLLKVIDTQTSDLEELRLSLSDQVALQKRIQEYMALLVVLFAEIESLRKRVKQTEKEIESVRRSSLAPFKV